VRRRDDDAVRLLRGLGAIVREDGVRDDRRRRVAVLAIDQGLHAIGAEHLQCRAQRGLRERMRVPADVERPGDCLTLAVIADRLGDREHVELVE